MFRIGVTRDFLNARGEFAFGEIGLARLDAAAGVAWEFLPDAIGELTSAHAATYDGLLVLGPRVTAATLAGRPRLAVVARFGVGYDNVDTEACTLAGVALTITPDGVRRPVAVAVLTFVLALSHKLLQKDKLTRAGGWHEKLDHIGMGVTGRTLGVIGLGNIGREVFRLAAPLEMRHLAADPAVSASDAAAAGAELVSLETLLAESDFVAICCALTKTTHHLIDAERLRLMKKTSYLINVARGPIVDQAALTEALTAKQIAGAGLDVFDPEPIDPGDPLLALDNVILAPHAVCWTDECFGNNGRSAIDSLLEIASGRVPRHVVNRSVIESPSFQAKLRGFAATP